MKPILLLLKKNLLFFGVKTKLRLKTFSMISKKLETNCRYLCEKYNLVEHITHAFN